jgi:transposase
MRGSDRQQVDLFSYLSPEQRVRADHPWRAIRVMTDQALENMSPRFDAMYAQTGRPSIPPEKLLRAQLLQMLYWVRWERLLRKEIDYRLLFRWFVGLNLDEPVWHVTVLTKNRNRLREGDLAREFLGEVVQPAPPKHLTSDEHFTVDGTLLEAWASRKSFQRQEQRLCRGMPEAACDTPGGTEQQTERRQCHGSTDHAAQRVRGQPEEAEANGRVFRRAQDHRAAAEGAASGAGESRVGVHVRGGGLPFGEDEKSAGPLSGCRLSPGRSAPAYRQSGQNRPQ